ncbi:glycoside hydrolase family 5 protein [Asticcacaulis sp. 201]|uniref:glycoside hydrolase family 5 protein n=1 Tax=Asticcacaulis sp. 201 TaxID=3028787 RepID=UPI002915EC48|nr:glycoside hydrolase family 5 protein [Asticcacaulis sp. 201]MDV6332991.1 glycoside hydrolase family 5 protein [Asticcacaulis sp. 201]
MRIVSLLSLAAVLACAPFTSQAQTPITPDAPTMRADRGLEIAKQQIDSYNSFANSNAKFEPISPEVQVQRMAAGVNVIGGYDPYWDGDQTKFSMTDFAKIRAAGFSTVRIPLFAFKHLTKDGHLTADYFKRLDQVVGAALANNLIVILDEHDFEICAKNADECAGNLANVWYELSDHFKSAPNSVIFELLNEPNGQVDDKIWNSWLIDLLGIIRESNPQRNVIVGPTHWNSRNDLGLLKLPVNDKHLIITFHYYDPMTFTHQGANWAGPELEKTKNVRWTGTAAELKTIDDDFAKVLLWSQAANRPIFLGEFGAYDKYGTLEDRAAWTKAVSESAHKHGFATAYWYWDGGFGVYDAEKKVWVKPILDALIPKGK